MMTVYTCILDGHDNLREPEVTPVNVEYVCFSDVPIRRAHWKIQPATRLMGSPSRDSRIPKILSHLHVDGEYSVWHDGCFHAGCDVRGIVADWLRNADIALFRHPARSNAYVEAEYCNRDDVNLGFDRNLMESINTQLALYRAEGFPGEPFFAGGIIARRECNAVRRFNELWWKEYSAWTRRDQFSLAYAVWRSGIRVHVIPDDILMQMVFPFKHHACFEDLSDNPRYAEERNRMAERKAQLESLCLK